MVGRCGSRGGSNRIAQYARLVTARSERLWIFDSVLL